MPGAVEIYRRAGGKQLCQQYPQARGFDALSAGLRAVSAEDGEGAGGDLLHDLRCPGEAVAGAVDGEADDWGGALVLQCVDAHGALDSGAVAGADVRLVRRGVVVVGLLSVLEAASGQAELGAVVRGYCAQGAGESSAAGFRGAAAGRDYGRGDRGLADVPAGGGVGESVGESVLVHPDGDAERGGEAASDCRESGGPGEQAAGGGVRRGDSDASGGAVPFSGPVASGVGFGGGVPGQQAGGVHGAAHWGGGGLAGGGLHGFLPGGAGAVHEVRVHGHEEPQGSEYPDSSGGGAGVGAAQEGAGGRVLVRGGAGGGAGEQGYAQPAATVGAGADRDRR